MKLKLIAAFFLLMISTQSSWGQVDPRLADDLFKVGNFLGAIPEYKKQIRVNPKNSKALFKLAQCYLNTNINKSIAIKYLEKANALEKKDKELLFYLAIAYTHNNDYEKAIETIIKYEQNPGKHIDEVPDMIKSYRIAIELMQNPVGVTFENMGQLINSIYPDYYPFITKDEKTLVFTSRREDGKGRMEFDGYYPSDIYVCSFNGLGFSAAKNSGSLNSVYDEQCVGIYDDGSKIFVYIDNFATKEKGNIYQAERKGSIYSKKKKISEGVNTKFIETSTSISSDGNAFVYASNRVGGSGGLDIYMTKKLPSGQWAMPQNLSSLNTPENEDFPVLSPDGQTLYFCSNGLPGMGGYDLYKSKWDEDQMEWAYPENIGYPLNTSYDEKTISFADDEKHAYISAVREGGIGDLDLYRVTFEKVDIRSALFIVEIKDALSNTKINNGKISVFMDNEDQPSIYKSNKNSYEFTLILEPGRYELEIEADGYKLSTIDLTVSEFDADQGMIKKSFKLSK